MKFGKVLKVSSENMPAEMHDLFLRYKELKKQIKLIPVSKDAPAGIDKQESASPDGSVTGSGSTGAAVTAASLSPEEQAFIATLNEDLTRFNRYFIEKEEEAVIRLQALCDQLAAAAAATGLHLPTDLMNTTSLSEAEHTHGEAVLLGPSPATRSQSAALQSSPPSDQLDEDEEDESEAEDRPAPLHEEGSPMDRKVMGPSTSSAGEPGEQEELAEPGQLAAVAEAAGGAAAAQRPVSPTQELAEQSSHHHHHHHQRLHYHTPGAAVGGNAPDLQAVKTLLVQFHGEMVLLLHWSLLNYAAVVKILKKHDKRTGVLLRAPYLANVLKQPFSSTTIMSRLAKRAEELVVATTQLGHPAAPTAGHVRAAGTAAVGGGGGGRSRGSPSGDAMETTAAAAEASAGTVSVHGEQPGGGTAAVGAPSGWVAAAGSASEASTLTFAAADKEPVYPTGSGYTKPLVGSTMHALQTWAALRKNAITPSTVLTAEAEQPQSGKRKAETEVPEAAPTARAPGSKLARSEETSVL